MMVKKPRARGTWCPTDTGEDAYVDIEHTRHLSVKTRRRTFE